MASQRKAALGFIVVTALIDVMGIGIIIPVMPRLIRELTVGRTVGEAFNWMHRLELSCRAQLAAQATQQPLQAVPPAVLEETWNNYQPGTRRPYGLMEWPALLRKLDRMDPGYRD